VKGKLFSEEEKSPSLILPPDYEKKFKKEKEKNGHMEKRLVLEAYFGLGK
jgi:hypothetical protein